MPSLFDTVRAKINEIMDLADRPALIYHVDFTGRNSDPSVNVMNLSGLWISTSGAPGENAEPNPGALNNDPALQDDGVHLSITRPVEDVFTNLMCGISPLPYSLLRFRLMGDFAVDPGTLLTPSGATDQWAITTVARGGDKSLITKELGPVGATHQVRDGGQIALGAGGGTNVRPPIRDEVVPQSEAYGFGDPLTFRLTADLNCYDGTGVSNLYTGAWPLGGSSGYRFMTRFWNHPYVATSTNVQPITCVGVGLGMAKGVGTLRTIARTFSIYAWPGRAPWWRDFVSNLLGITVRLPRP